jgi:hypothetical protein
MTKSPTWIAISASLLALLQPEASAAALTLGKTTTRTSTTAVGATSTSSGGSLAATVAAGATVSFLAPSLSVRGQRAILYWRAGSDLRLSVAFGETPALGSYAAEPVPPVRTAAPTLEVHQVRMDGLAMGTPHYYRGTLSRGGVVVADTGLLSFETPLAFVRVRPVEIEMHKDGDHDIEVSALGQELYDNDNEGEVYLEWNVKVRPEPGGWPWSPKVKGCYPGGASIATNFPTHSPDLGDGTPQPEPGQDDSDVQYPNTQGPDAGNAPDDWADVNGCVAYSYSNPIAVNDARVGSGDTVELDADGYPVLEWTLPDGLPSAPGAIASALAPDGDGDGEPDWTPGGTSDTSEATPPCGDAPPGTFALVRIGVRGQEFDTAPGIGTTAGSFTELTRIINHDASESDVLCLDLRDKEQTYLFGVRAEDGSFEFTDWFEVTLDYRLVGEAPPEDEELAALGTPIVVEPR